VLLGLFLTPLIAPFLQAHVTSNGFHARLIAFFFVLGGTGFLLRMAASVAEVKSESNLPKQERDLRRADDRILGGVFGALKGSVLALLLVAAAVTFFPRLRLWNESALAHPLSVAGSRLLPANVMRDAAGWASRSAEDVRTGLDIKP
jgi:Colicin V production protein